LPSSWCLRPARCPLRKLRRGWCTGTGECSAPQLVAAAVFVKQQMVSNMHTNMLLQVLLLQVHGHWRCHKLESALAPCVGQFWLFSLRQPSRVVCLICHAGFGSALSREPSHPPTCALAPAWSSSARLPVDLLCPLWTHPPSTRCQGQDMLAMQHPSTALAWAMRESMVLVWDMLRPALCATSKRRHNHGRGALQRLYVCAASTMRPDLCLGAWLEWSGLRVL
jgi:hypothetical protein